ncbi:MAG TPA: UDP-N-acetylglucosamine 2-epimerase (non-hydrolyzing) [Solirubrobacteraceae bacterium]|nr:UDP-N-acetylglucosamine 2-epimerase (non-hydrolyzing) [Solirubrobacteraceae bacterium]
MRILTVVGNRPQFVKAAAVSRPLRAVHEEVLVHTGQHFDDALSAVFFRELAVPEPDHRLGIAGGSNTSQTSRMLAALEPVLAAAEPDCVLVYGDTNSTLAGALCAVQAGLPLAHVEAGMRSFDRAMPEEVNRVLTDHVSSLLLCSSAVAVGNLKRESVAGAIELVGDVMVDVALAVQPRARERADVAAAYGLERGGYLLVTAHRAGNVDDPERLRALVELLRALPLPAIFPVHPRTRRRLEDAGLVSKLGDGERRLILTDPVGYLELTALLCHSRAVLTDSGGLQKEAYLAGVPCLTLRPSTEWTETVQAGWNTLVDLDAVAALEALERDPPAQRPPLYGDGRAGERIVTALERFVAAGAAATAPTLPLA